jgi:hypothetical protein
VIAPLTTSALAEGSDDETLVPAAIVSVDPAATVSGASTMYGLPAGVQLWPPTSPETWVSAAADPAGASAITPAITLATRDILDITPPK